MDEGFDWYDPEQTGALIESQQAELIELREEGVRLRAENERLRGALREYANSDHWRIYKISVFEGEVVTWKYVSPGEKIARAALEGTGE